MGQRDCVIVIPAFNEAATIGELVTQLRKEFAVIVVDDASTDNTQYNARQSGALVVQHQKNLGYEAALNTGFKEAALRFSDGVVITMDADGEHNVNSALSFKRHFENDAVVLVLGVRQSVTRVSEKIIGRYLRWRYGVSDIFCGMKGYDIALWRNKGFFDSGQSVGTELALGAVRGGVPFIQTPVLGSRRSDNPRFGSGLKVTFRLIKGALIGILAPEVTLKKQRCGRLVF